MKYIDTGSRDPNQALGKWLGAFEPQKVREVRIQSGFFSLSGIGILLPVLKEHLSKGLRTTILIGSNERSTLRADVLALAGYMGIPRERARLGVVSFSNAFFHPKTYHVTRQDGSQAAYVGSANLSAAGLSLHVEAGICLDSREGDSVERLTEVATAIDAWFDQERDGLHIIEGIENIDSLVTSKVLAASQKAKPKSEPVADDQVPDGSSDQVAKPKLVPVLNLPTVSTTAFDADVPMEDQDEGDPSPAEPSGVFSKSPTTGEAASDATQGEAAGHQSASSVIAVPKQGMPQYLLFDPNANGPTSGAFALTGSGLPAGAIGLVVQLNLDSARHFMGGVGTANISIPVAAIGTIRFGEFGLHKRPRAEFPLRFRFIADTGVTLAGQAKTNIQGYGYTPTESGHADIRMLVPAALRELGERIREHGFAAPTNGDYALLEWPTPQVPMFSLTLLGRNGELFARVSDKFTDAINNSQIVGQGACWLYGGESPTW